MSVSAMMRIATTKNFSLVFIAVYVFEVRLLIKPLMVNLNFIVPVSSEVSPNKKPYGFSGSTLSRISLRIATRGMDKNIPDMPQSAAPKITAMMEMSALSFTFEPIIFGMI